MRKWIVIWVGVGLVLMGRVAQGANPSALLGIALGLGLGLLLTLLAVGAGARMREMLQLTRLEDQILSVHGQTMPGDLAEGYTTNLDLAEAWMIEMQEGSIWGQDDPPRRFEQVEDLPRVEFLTELTR